MEGEKGVKKEKGRKGKGGKKGEEMKARKEGKEIFMDWAKTYGERSPLLENLVIVEPLTFDLSAKGEWEREIGNGKGERKKEAMKMNWGRGGGSKGQKGKREKA